LSIEEAGMKVRRSAGETFEAGQAIEGARRGVLLEVPQPPDPGQPLPDPPVAPPSPDGPGVPEPSPPQEPDPGAPDVPSTDPKGPETFGGWAA
jgi:hypothetical protein